MYYVELWDLKCPEKSLVKIAADKIQRVWPILGNAKSDNMGSSLTFSSVFWLMRRILEIGLKSQDFRI